ncbi:hypothetical protein ABZ502_29920 [Streptomyces abikoensis]|uniref:hypothetical protein n=1 Tax=Streptomyces abikoensis TaxID=97398 RepID=UPI0033CC6095
MSGHNEISGGRFEVAIQAQHLHGDVVINGWNARWRAEAVTAWTGPAVGACPARAGADSGWTGHHFHVVVVHNGSPQPIHEVVVCVPTPHAGLLPGEEPLMIVAVGLVPPGERAEVTIGDQGQFEPQFAVPLEVHFRDVDGTEWCRNEDGRLDSALQR